MQAHFPSLWQTYNWRAYLAFGNCNVHRGQQHKQKMSGLVGRGGVGEEVPPVGGSCSDTSPVCTPSQILLCLPFSFSC